MYVDDTKIFSEFDDLFEHSMFVAVSRFLSSVLPHVTPESFDNSGNLLNASIETLDLDSVSASFGFVTW